MSVRAAAVACHEVAVVTHRGRGRHNTDAVAHFTNPSTGRQAFALACGSADSPAAAWAASVATDHSVRAAVRSVDAAEAVLATREVVTFGAPTGDASLAMVLSPRPGTVGGYWTVGWAGDCRAYAWDGDDLIQLTTDHTVATETRSRGWRPEPPSDRVLTTSLRRVGPRTVGLTTARDPAWLVLLTAPVRRLIDQRRLADLLARGATARDKAELLFLALDDADPSENATALIVGCGAPAERRSSCVDGAEVGVPAPVPALA